MSDLRCPFCGGPLWVNVSAADPPLIECDDTKCWAEWDRDGKLQRPPIAAGPRPSGTFTEADSRDPYDPGNRAPNHT